MRLRYEISLGLGALLGLQVITTVGSIRVLSRMSPAVEQIMKENVASQAASEEMLAALTRIESNPGAPLPERFQAGFTRARANVTLGGEAAILDSVEKHAPAAFAGDPMARGILVRALQDLSELNREAMREADERARLLGRAGAWASIALGLTGFWLTISVGRRLRARLETPIVELDETLEAARRGERLRRVALIDGPAEARRLADNINWLLDREEAGLAARPTDASIQRALALHLLDREPLPAVVVNGDGEIVATNQAALSRLDPGARGIPAGLRRVPPADPPRPIDGWLPERIGAWPLWIWRRADATRTTEADSP